MLRNLTAALSALALVMAVAPAALAADVTETLAVDSVLSLQLSTAAIDYGHAAIGTESTHAPVVATVTSNSAWTLSVSGTDLTGPAGTIDTTSRMITATAPPSVTIDAFVDGGGSVMAAPQVFASGAAGTLADVNVSTELYVSVTGSQAAGDYSGTVTFTLAGS